MLVYGKYELYVCVLCASCGRSQCCILHDLQVVLSGFSVILFCPGKNLM